MSYAIIIMDLPLKIPECSISMVEELLAALGDWRGTQDVVRLTIKALTEVVKIQSMSISHINRSISILPDAQYFKDLENKITESNADTLEKVESIVQDKVTRKDLKNLFGGKSYQDLLKEKVSLEEFYTECKGSNDKIESLQTEFNRKILEISMDKELHRLNSEIKEKPTWKEIQEALDDKVSQSYFLSALNKKVNRSDLEEAIKPRLQTADLNSFNARLDSKIDKNIFESFTASVDQRFNKICEITDEINEKNPAEYLKEIEYKINELNKQLKSETDNLKKTLTSLSAKKVDTTETDILHDNLKQKLDYKEALKMHEKLSKDLKKTINDYKKDIKLDISKSTIPIEIIDKFNTDINIIKSQIIEVLEDRKKDTIEHSQFLKASASQIKKDLKDDLSKMSSEIENVKDNILENLIKKQEFAIYKQDLKSLNENKLNQEEFSKFSNEFHQEHLKSIKDLKGYFKSKISKSLSKLPEPTIIKESPKYSEAIHSILLEISGIKSELKVNTEYLNNYILTFRSLLDNLSNDLKAKASTKDLLALIEMKANIEDTNKALIEIHKELDSKVDAGHYTRHMGGYEQSLARLWNVCSIGRWAWKSGDLKTGSLVPWENEISNTVPEVFLWEKDKTSIIVMTAGIYLLNLAVFSKKKNRIGVAINGNDVLDTSGKSNGNNNEIFSEYLVIPARGRVSVAYIGDKAQGIIELIKFT